MKINVVVPVLGPNMHEATFVTWLKKAGDTVAAEECIAEVMTDKVNIDVIAPVSGVLITTLAEPDQLLGVDGVLGVIETEEIA